MASKNTNNKRTDRKFAVTRIKNPDPAGNRSVNRFHACQVFDVTGKIGRPLAVEFVGLADLHLVEFAENIEQSDRQAVDAADACAVTGGDGIEPAASPRTARDGSIFVPGLANMLSDIVVEFGRKRPLADARRICLGNAEHIVERAGTQPRPRRGLCGHRVG